MCKLDVAFVLNGKIKKGTVLETRDTNDQDRDWLEYLIKYSYFKKPIWIPWWWVWTEERLNKKHF